MGRHHPQPARRPRWLTALACSAAVTFMVSLTWVSPTTAVADDPTGGVGPNTCTSQPRADQDPRAGADGWGVVRGGDLRRDPAGDDSTDVVAQQLGNTILDPEVFLPAQPVEPGQLWEFGYSTAVDSVAVAGAAQARVEVEWLAGDGHTVGREDGPWILAPVHHDAGTVHVAAEFDVPAAAVTARVLAELDAAALPYAWGLTGCDYRLLADAAESDAAPPAVDSPAPAPEPTATASAAPRQPDEPDDPSEPTTPAPPQPGPPPAAGSGQTAADRFGWGTPIAAGSDEFNGGGLDESKWSVYDSAGHDGNGRRTPENVSVAGGLLTLTGEANGDSAGMAAEFGQQYGRWEARVRSQALGDGGDPYHVLLIVWPDSNQRVEHGEYDFLEQGAPGQACAEAFMHYPGETPTVQEHAVETGCGAPLSEWHHVALEWTPDALVGYLDGQEWFRFGEADITGMPSGHLTIQLDAFSDGGLQPAEYQVDWVRTYALAGAP